MWQRFLILKDNKSQNALDKDSCKDVFQDFYCEIEKKVTEEYRVIQFNCGNDHFTWNFGTFRDHVNKLSLRKKRKVAAEI